MNSSLLAVTVYLEPGQSSSTLGSEILTLPWGE